MTDATDLTPEERSLLVEALEYVVRSSPASLPKAQDFRLAHEKQRTLITRLIKDNYLRDQPPHYRLTIEGLVECHNSLADRVLETCDLTLDALKAAYRTQPNKNWSTSELSVRAGRSPDEIGHALAILSDKPIAAQYDRNPSTGLFSGVVLTESVLDVEPIAVETGWKTPLVMETPSLQRPKVKRIQIDGYRPFANFSAEPGDLTVIIGANASGKSSLFDFLRFLTFAAVNPLPPEIDPRSVGRTLFHAGYPERFTVVLDVDYGQIKPLRYELEIHGPIGNPRVVRERLATSEPLTAFHTDPFIFLDFKNGKGTVRDQQQRRLARPEWIVKPNELALRRALDPTLLTLSKFQGFVSSWRFYSGFDVSVGAAIRRPVPTEPSPTLREDGSNLSAVLFWLRAEHSEAWEELETVVRAAIPGFQSIVVKPRGGPGTVIGSWREDGLSPELTLADLSDGTLRLLCWATLCLAPSIPSLICIDEPELGLHPRALPILAGLLRKSASRSQVLVATHSPYLLAHFELEQVAVMRKQAGRALFVRPSDSSSLRKEIQELGGEELARLHVSDELEARS